MNKEIIDIEDVMERVQDDYELFMELLEIFEQDYAKKMKLLSSAVGGEDLVQLKDIVHSIKGATGNISAKSMHVLCEKIERLIEKKDIEGIAGALKELDEQFVQVQACIVELKENPRNK